MVLAVASEEPQTEPNPAQAAIAAMAVPPRSQPNQALAALNRAADSPVLAARHPMRTNIGTTDSPWNEN